MLLMHIGRLALHLHSIGDFDAALPLKQEHRRLALGIDRPEASALGLAFYRDALPVKSQDPSFFFNPASAISGTNSEKLVKKRDQFRCRNFIDIG